MELLENNRKRQVPQKSNLESATPIVKSIVYSNLEQLEDSIIQIDQIRLAEIQNFGFWQILGSSLITALPSLIRSVVTLLGFVVLNLKKEGDTTAYFSLYRSLQTIFYTPVYQALATLLTILTSQSLSKSRASNLAKKYFTQTLIVFFTYMALFYIPFIWNLDLILPKLGIDNRVAAGVKEVTKKTLPSDLLEALSYIVIGFCNCQKIEKIFSILSWSVAIPVMVGEGLVLHFTDMGFDSYIAARTIYQGVLFLTFIHVYVTQTLAETQGLCSLREALDGIGFFTSQSAIFCFGLILEWVGWEIGGIFTALSNDVKQIAAWGSMLSIALFTFDFSYGFVTILRTRLNFLLGAGEAVSAKEFSIKVIEATSAFAFVLGLCLFFGREAVLKLYTNQNELEYTYLSLLLVLYSFFIQADINYSILTVICRSTNHLCFSLVNFAIFALIGNIGASLYLRVKVQADCTAFFISQYSCLLVAIVVCLVKVFSYDWRKVTILVKS